jgi:hypothetical protein
MFEIVLWDFIELTVTRQVKPLQVTTELLEVLAAGNILGCALHADVQVERQHAAHWRDVRIVFEFEDQDSLAQSGREIENLLRYDALLAYVLNDHLHLFLRGKTLDVDLVTGAIRLHRKLVK